MHAADLELLAIRKHRLPGAELCPADKEHLSQEFSSAVQAMRSALGGVISDLPSLMHFRRVALHAAESYEEVGCLHEACLILRELFDAQKRLMPHDRERISDTIHRLRQIRMLPSVAGVNHLTAE
jgi:hypothetical protein